MTLHRSSVSGFSKTHLELALLTMPETSPSSELQKLTAIH
jgi:hypothetical protein